MTNRNALLTAAILAVGALSLLAEGLLTAGLFATSTIQAGLPYLSGLAVVALVSIVAFAVLAPKRKAALRRTHEPHGEAA